MVLNFLLFLIIFLWYLNKFKRKPQEEKANKKPVVLKLLELREIPEICCNLPQYANVRSCNCCPYGYHIDLDFVRYCESLANAKPSEEELQRRCRRRSRKSMEFMLGLDSIFDQWDSSDRQQTLTELPQENELDSPYHSLQRTPSFTSTPYQYQPLRHRSSSVPRFNYGSQNSNYPRSESPFGTASSTCSSYRGAESDVPYPMRKPAVSPPETKAFLHDALDEVCSDFERTLERASMKRKKAGQREDAGGGDMGGRIIKPGLNNYYSMDRNNNYPKAMSYSYQERPRNGGWNWDSATYTNTRDSCVTGNKSPRASSIYSKTLPFQQKLSPAEQQYESYVKATVAANAKSPVEELLSPPTPPPRRHTLTAKLSLTSPPTAFTTTDSAQSPSLEQVLTSCLVSPSKESAAAAAATAADAQTLFNIRQQMALSLKRMKDLEEQVKAIPNLQSELSQLREEKQRLQQTVKNKEEELLKAKEATRFSSSPSPVLTPKLTSPVQFQPQRVSPISLESMGARMQSSNNKSPILKRDVATMCSKQTTRDIAVGSPIPAHKTQRDVGCNAGLTKNITENLYTKTDVEERIKLSIRQHEEQKKLERLKDLISVGTQMYVAKKDTKDSMAQTKPEPKVQKHNVSVMAQPTTRESYTNCRPDVRSVGSSNDCVSDVLCEKCLVTKRSIACATEDDAKGELAKTVSLKLLDMPARSNTFSLGDNEKLNISKKSTGTQYTPIVQHSAGSQTSAVVQHTVGVQFKPQQQNNSTQFELYTMARQTDTKDLIRLCTSQTNTEEISAPTPVKEKKPEPIKPILHTKGCNTELKNYTDHGVNTLPPVTTSSTSCNTEEIHKRDIACGDIVKPHISIACADNYCDSCKDAIKNLAKDFSKVLASPLPTRAAESKIPRPKNLPSPSPVRRQFSRQNTYTVTPSPTPSPVTEKKNMASSLQEKSSSTFHQLESSGESQSFINEPVTLSAITTQNPKSTTATTTIEEKLPSSNTSPEGTPQRKSLYDLSQLGDNELIVREETRVSISWSRDNSPAPTPTPATASNSCIEPSTEEDKLKAQAEVATACAKEISQGARKKTLPSPLKSSHEGKSKPETPQEEDLPQKPLPSKALLQKIAMKETEPRKKISPPKDMLAALKTINSSLLKKLGSKPMTSLSLKSSKQTIQQEWFRLSSSENADPHEVEDYLDCFEELSVPLLEYCVNMVDANGNTAMHYAVSHGNFDVVSILLDSKVCNVNQMNNAGYTCVMLVSLAKLKNPEHRTVVERLFQMADVNIRAKKHCQTALMLAVSHGNLEMVQLLLAAGADINIQDEDGSTALMCAAEHGRSDIVKHLLTHTDCDSLIQDVDGSTAFKIAWQAGHRDIGIFLYVHEQMLRSKMPNRGENLTTKRSPPATSPRYTHKRKPSK
ncbi:KN motif and ankyrin repeat domain-containing protein 1 isoform X2 [Calliphora vicina]|uniref:KN motif and ankyrin repeat domain-containing protein 1 isoform X2 n=1 Tax=Calliphora vicina TaxID=7373 RepID=UPI00325B4E6B